MDYEEIIRRLREPFGSKEIEWKIQVNTQDKKRGMAVAYLDARAVQKRLDDTVGPFNWKNVYSLWHDNSQICGISIFHDGRKEWVTKFDGAENSDFEPIKGGLSDSFKRAAAVWGIGRYLYEMEGVWVEIEARGKSFTIKQSEYGRLEKEYNSMVGRISSTKPSQQETASRQPQTAPAADTRQGQAASTADARQIDNAPAYDYKVRSIRPSGKSSQFLEMVDRGGSVVKAYIRATDQSIKPGTCLNNVQIEKKNGNYGEYNLISTYQLAA